MREVISVHVGQAGVQIGNACCERSFSLYLSRAYDLIVYAQGNFTRSNTVSVCVSLIYPLFQKYSNGDSCPIA